MTSAASERQIRKRQQKAREDRAGAELTIRAVMATRHGRRWVWCELGACGVFHSNPSRDPMQSAFTEGQRDAGLRLLKLVSSVCPQLYMTMTTENTGVDVTEQTNDDPDHAFE